MIFKWITDAISGFISFIIYHFPAPTVPTWLSDLNTRISSIFLDMKLGAWFPGSLVTFILASWAGAYAIAVTIKLTRMVASYLTGGGGSAA